MMNQSPGLIPRARISVAVAIGCVMPLVAAFYAWRYTPPVPMADHWSIVAPFLCGYAEGTLKPGDFNQQHNDSRMTVVRILETGLAVLTKWSFRAETLSIVLLGALCSAGALFLLRRSFESGSGEKIAWVWAGMSLLIFHPLQSMNWVFGVVLAYFLLVFFVVMIPVVFTLRVPIVIRFGAGALLATGALYCFLCGFLAWGVLLLMLMAALRAERARSSKWMLFVAAWAAALGVAAATFFHGYQWNSGTRFIETAMKEPLIAASFFPAWLGSPFCQLPFLFGVERGSWDYPVSVIFGLVGLAAAGWLAISKGKKGCEPEIVMKAAPWVALMLFALGNGALITVGRLEMGASAALLPRYIIFSAWFWAGLLALFCLPSLGGVSFRPRLAWVTAGALFLAAIWGGWRWGVVEMQRHFYSTRPLEAALRFSRVAWQEEALNVLAWTDLAGLRRYLPILHAHGYLRAPLYESGFVADHLIAAPADNSSATSRHHGEVESVKFEKDRLVLSGWAVRVAQREPAHAVIVTYEPAGGKERVLMVADKMVSRPKFAKKYRVKVHRGRVGWRAALPPGEAEKLEGGALRFYAYDLGDGSLSRLPIATTLGGGERVVVPGRSEAGGEN